MFTIGFLAFFVAIFALIKGKLEVIKIHNRKSALIMLVAAFLIMLIFAPESEQVSKEIASNDNEQIRQEEEQNENEEEENNLSQSTDDFDTDASLRLTDELFIEFKDHIISEKNNTSLDGVQATILISEEFSSPDREYLFSTSVTNTLVEAPIYLLAKFPQLEKVIITLENFRGHDFTVELDRERYNEMIKTDPKSSEQRMKLKTDDNLKAQLISNYGMLLGISEELFQEAIAIEQDELRRDAKSITYRDINRAGNDRIEGPIRITGQILQLLEGNGKTQIRLAPEKDDFGYDVTKVVWIDYDGYTDFYDDDIVTIYGYHSGTTTYQALSGLITLPSILAEIIE